jgi:hypothetical protein
MTTMTHYPPASHVPVARTRDGEASVAVETFVGGYRLAMAEARSGLRVTTERVGQLRA